MTARNDRRSQPVPVGVVPSSARASVRSGGYPAMNSRDRLQDAKMQLEQMRKETLEIRAAEARLRWGMKREEEKLRTIERQEDASKLLESTSAQRDETARHLEAERRSRKDEEILDSRNFQEHKR